MLAFLTAAFTFVIAQENGGGDGGSPSATNYIWVIYIAIFVAFFYFFLIRPGQKQRKMHDELVQSINKGDEVVTTGGIFGKVTKVADDYVMIEIAKKTEVKLSRGSIASRTSVEAQQAPEAKESPEAMEAPETGKSELPDKD